MKRLCTIRLIRPDDFLEILWQQLLTFVACYMHGDLLAKP